MIEAPTINPLNIRNSPERRALAAQILLIREIERKKQQPDYPDGGFIISGDGNWYLNELCGLTSLFQYVRELRSSNYILDIGAGITKGIYDISTDPLGSGLDFMATTLTQNKRVNDYLGYDKTKITSAELLKNIRVNSIGGVLAVNSIAYSCMPEIAMLRLDEVLVPGGVFKGVFRGKTKSGVIKPQDFFDRTGFKTHDRFSQTLRELGYDISIVGFKTDEVMLAVKRGGPLKTSAEDLLEADLIEQQVRDPFFFFKR